MLICVVNRCKPPLML